MSGIAAGVPLNIVLTIVSASTCAPLAGAAVYLWHCDREGRYSLYNAGRHQPELPARRPGGRRERPRHVPVDLSRLLCRTLAAHSLRGLSQSERRDQRSQQDGDVADRAPEGSKRRGLRDGRLRASVRNAAQVTLASGQHLQRWLGTRTRDNQWRRNQRTDRDPHGRRLDGLTRSNSRPCRRWLSMPTAGKIGGGHGLSPRSPTSPFPVTAIAIASRIRATRRIETPRPAVVALALWPQLAPAAISAFGRSPPST